LHVEGRYIKNDLDEVVDLRGVNQQGYVDHPSGYWRPTGGGLWSGGTWLYWPQAMFDNLDEMRRWGFNCIRVHQCIQYWLENTDNYIGHFKEFLSAAASRGMYVIFDAYTIRPYPNVYQWPLPYAPYAQDPNGTLVMPNRTAFVNYWGNVASELRDYANVIFEIYNEPHGDNETEDEYFAMAQQAIEIIRTAGCKQLVSIQWGYSVWANLNYPDSYRPEDVDDWVYKYPLNDSLSNIVYQTHNYRAYGQFHYSSPTRVNVWEYNDLVLGYNCTGVLKVAQEHPVLLGEFGADGSEFGTSEWPRELAYLNNSLQLFENYGIHWTVMTWTTVSHIRYGLLNNTTWVPPPNEAGQVVIDILAYT